MSGYVVLVDFHLKRGGLETFRGLIDINARQSAQMEPGCRRFDVIEPHAAADAVLLYEVYRNRTDLDAHMRSEHYARFGAQARDLS
jgi:(4S)-4-hydroxy-5-phosphonooxypentane-2,3-dione isomerase